MRIWKPVIILSPDEKLNSASDLWIENVAYNAIFNVFLQLISSPNDLTVTVSFF